MTLHAVTVPKWGLAMEEGTLTAWLTAEGVIVAAGDPVAEIETTKIANALEAPVAGALVRQVAPLGETLPVGALLAVIADDGEDDAAVDAFVAAHATRAATVEITDRPEPVIAEIGGQPFRYLRLAPGAADQDARPVVLIHGFGGDLSNWMFNQTALAQDRPAYAVDLPGHGGSTKTVGAGSLSELAAWIEAWMATLGRGRVHLVGHSMGAAVAATLAIDFPERVKTLTAINGVGFGGTLGRDYIEGFLAAPRRKALKPVVELLFADPALLTREMLDDLIAAKRIDGAAEALRLLADEALGPAAIGALAARLGEIAVPVLRIVGSEDRVVTGAPRDGAIVVAAGHMPHLEAAGAVNAALADFLRAHD